MGIAESSLTAYQHLAGDDLTSRLEIVEQAHELLANCAPVAKKTLAT
jgi:hypothetical protein